MQNIKTRSFELPDQNGKIHRLSDYLGKWVVLYFYPRDDTPGCTKEACGFRDIAGEFAKSNAVIIGISKDSVDSHLKFAQKFRLNFPILSDPDKKVIRSFGAWGMKKFMGRSFEGTLRNTVLIDPEGKTVREYRSVNPLNHPAEVLRDIRPS